MIYANQKLTVVFLYESRLNISTFVTKVELFNLNSYHLQEKVCRLPQRVHYSKSEGGMVQNFFHYTVEEDFIESRKELMMFQNMLTRTSFYKSKL